MLALALLAGCGTVGLVGLGDLEGCDPDVATGVDGSALDLHRTATPDLACTLSGLRDVIAPNAHQSIQGARVCAEMSARTTDADRMERFARECIRWARQAGNDAATRGEARYLEGVCLGNSVRHSAFKAVKSLPKLERTLADAIRADPAQDDGGPLRVLGMLYVKAPAWPQGIGDVDRGLEMIGEAVERFPDHPLNRLFMAMALWDVEEDRDAAVAEFAAAMDLMKSDRWTHIAPFWRKEAAGLAGELGVAMPE